MSTGADLRRVALSLEGVSEAPHFDRAAFRYTKIFVTLAADGLSANFKYTPDQQEFKCMLDPAAFAPVPGERALSAKVDAGFALESALFF